MVSNARLDLPEPDRPVNTIIASRGRSRLTSLRLCSRAPRTIKRSFTKPRVMTRADNALARKGQDRGMARTIATTTTVELPDLLDFIRPRHDMVLITHRRDSTPQVSPVTGGVDDHGRIVVASYPERAKVTNLRRSSACSVLVLSDDFGGPWVQVAGEAEVLDLPQALEPLVD